MLDTVEIMSRLAQEIDNHTGKNSDYRYIGQLECSNHWWNAGLAHMLLSYPLDGGIIITGFDVGRDDAIELCEQMLVQLKALPTDRV